MKRSRKMRQTQKMSQRLTRKQVIIIASSTITVFVIALVLAFNFLGIRNVFAAGTTYYSRADGAWDSNNSWSTSGYGGSAASSYPGTGDIVLIKNNAITVSASNVSAASLSIEASNKLASLTVSNGKTITLTGDISIKSSAVKNVSIDISGTGSGISTSGNLSLDRTGTGDISLTLANSSTLTAANITTTNSGNNSGVSSISLTDNAVATCTGNLSLARTSGTYTASVTCDLNSIFNVYGNINFNANASSVTTFSLASSATLNLKGNITRLDASQQYGTFTTASGTNVVLNGSGVQTIGYGTTTDTLSIAKLTINNAAVQLPQIALGGPLKVSSQLVLTNGVILSSSTAPLVLTAGATSSRASTASYVSGQMQKRGNQAFIFPTGKNGLIGEIGISAPTYPSAKFTAEYFNSSYSNTTPQFGVQNISSKEYWSLAQNFGSNTLKVTLYWADASFSRIWSPSGLVVARYASATSDWATAGNFDYTINGNAGSLTSNSTSIFGNFTFGSTNGNPLPVKLTEFKAAYSNPGVNLAWQTSSEINNEYFSIERSRDGEIYEAIGKVKGAGNSQKLLSYNFTDNSPYSGISYYRLKQNDFNGKFEYSPVRNVKVPVGNIESISPNPFADHFNAQFTLETAGEVAVQLLLPTGGMVFEQQVQGMQGSNTFEYYEGHNLRPGLYVLRIVKDGEIISSKVIKS